MSGAPEGVSEASEALHAPDYVRVALQPPLPHRRMHSAALAAGSRSGGCAGVVAAGGRLRRVHEPELGQGGCGEVLEGACAAGGRLGRLGPQVHVDDPAVNLDGAADVLSKSHACIQCGLEVLMQHKHSVSVHFVNPASAVNRPVCALRLSPAQVVCEFEVCPGGGGVSWGMCIG